MPPPLLCCEEFAIVVQQAEGTPPAVLVRFQSRVGNADLVVASQ